MAVFSHTTSGSSAKAVCLFYYLIGIMSLYLLLFYFSEQHSSWSGRNKISFSGVKILGPKTD